MDLEKLSGLVENKEESSDGGINPLEAIKSLTGLVKDIKSLGGQAKGIIPPQVQNKPQVQTLEDIPVKPIPKVKEPVKEPIKPKPVEKSKEITEEDINKKYDMVLKMLDFTILVYGDIVTSKLKENLQKDRTEIIKKIKPFINNL